MGKNRRKIPTIVILFLLLFPRESFVRLRETYFLLLHYIGIEGNIKLNKITICALERRKRAEYNFRGAKKLVELGWMLLRERGMKGDD